MNLRSVGGRLLVGWCVAAMLVGCGSAGSPVPGTAAPAAQGGGCGADYADPEKRYCVTLASGWQEIPHKEADELGRWQKFGGSDSSGVFVKVGLESSFRETLDKQVAWHERSLREVVQVQFETGATKGGAGRWWLYEKYGSPVIDSVAVAANGKLVFCRPTNTHPTSVMIEVCKSIRPYPTT